jgi:hypothetical protein
MPWLSHPSMLGLFQLLPLDWLLIKFAHDSLQTSENICHIHASLFSSG